MPTAGYTHVVVRGSLQVDGVTVKPVMGVGLAKKLAVTVRLVDITNVHVGLEPLHAPDHELNLELAVSAAVNVILVPSL